MVAAPNPRINSTAMSNASVNASVNASTDVCSPTASPEGAYLCSTGLQMFPLVDESTWTSFHRATNYVVGLIWLFLGVASLSDVFMMSIETITSKTRTVKTPDASAEGGFVYTEERVWNDTVANLSLMALGTSAPEILLAVVEIVLGNFCSGPLGPSTIVGSAAFNLLFISAICIYSIPTGEVRRIEKLNVFWVTSCSCIGAYLWMAFVLLGWTPEVVTLEEACITCSFFPLLIIVAYFVEKRSRPIEQPIVTKGASVHESSKISMHHDKSGISNPSSLAVSVHGMQISPKANGSFTSELSNKIISSGTVSKSPKDIIIVDNMANKDSLSETDFSITDFGVRRRSTEPVYRLSILVSEGVLTENEAIQIMTYSETKTKKNPLQKQNSNYRSNAIRMMSGKKPLVTKVITPAEEYVSNKKHKKSKKAHLSFKDPSVRVSEDCGSVNLAITRDHGMDWPVSVRVSTFDGTACAYEDYIPIDQVVEFGEHQTVNYVNIDIIDDNDWEPEEFFEVKLSVDNDSHASIGHHGTCVVSIIDNDRAIPGTIVFTKPSYIVMETSDTIKIPVIRMHGFDGLINVKWTTKDFSAKEGVDFRGREGTLLFADRETFRIIEIPLVRNFKQARGSDFFELMLEIVSPKEAKLGVISSTIVNLIEDIPFREVVNIIKSKVSVNLSSSECKPITYKDQFKDAVYVSNEDGTATAMTYIMHLITVFWKVLFAFIPPPHYCGGWMTFVVSLIFIGGMTTVIGEMAKMFGCLAGVPDSVTAITFVALGTSMPDTFASMTAARMEPTADSSVGNVNGSNSVNVFLGLGLPWLIATIYWKQKGKIFHVPSGDLAYSVIVYTACAVVAIAALSLRRKMKGIGAELGGPKKSKIISSIFFVCLWFVYIILSILKATKYI